MGRENLGRVLEAIMDEEGLRNFPAIGNRWAKEAGIVAAGRLQCHCLDAQYDEVATWKELVLHGEVQDTEAPGWKRLAELIEEVAADGREEFSPGREMDAREWAQVITLPASIGTLKLVKHLILYGSSLVRIPPEIGEMSALEEFTPYTSYRLHWFPYEITRCTKLKRSTVSTRALYGNYKFRPPFPRLPQVVSGVRHERCSVCEGGFGGRPPMQAWISLLVARDVLPLLVHACSEACLRKLGDAPEGYVSGAHQGGLDLLVPDCE